MASKGLMAYLDRYNERPDMRVGLIGEPVTLPDGSEYGIFDVLRSSSGQREVHVVNIGAGKDTQHQVHEHDILRVGDGDFFKGAMVVARQYLPTSAVN